MNIFVTGTGTEIGKTLVSSWLCLHTNYDYFKPIQTGSCDETDSQVIARLTNSRIHKEVYLYKEPVSPHLAAKLENDRIDLDQIMLPKVSKLIIEGAGGLLVPINQQFFMIDLICKFSVPVIVVASSRLGTINHTLLSLEALRARGIEILGVIVSGESNQYNCDAIEFYGATKILAQIPLFSKITKQNLQEVALTQSLKQILGM